ncbi:riboflavin synthase [Heyndrickxia acidiproducens]|uniref:riboflavin synthase n=1 Tax=Heyndrickxia acidiproducens TaxID=1121084 RepID=UPI0003778F87|nr:riboflavin synthase [Heyndrickxia acidiproducens]
MFTGIIEEIGVLKNIRQRPASLQLDIQAKEVLNDVRAGDSISVDGVCLTVTSFTKKEFSVDVMPETFQDTTLAQLHSGSEVNLERAMRANGRFGGHFVSGHVDGTGTIRSLKRVENALYISIAVSDSLAPYCIPKGSVAVNGTSLTIFEVKGNLLTISLIPHTRQLSNIAKKKVGEKVNIECDMLAKYIESMLQHMNGMERKPNTMDLLRKNGFLSE